ncbi:MAG TPA: HAMP domain-containing sensor histidine kinase [Burkholderiales bacterium]|nr:HAMP domain-containing sensor histidine kinase [Burkholderiales bacterium]
MLHEFLSENYQTLVGRCRAKVSRRTIPWASNAELLHGIPLFLDQLIRTLQIEQTATPLDSLKVSGPSEAGKTPASSEIGTTAAKHGNELLRQGFTVDQVVHDYGDLCQAITDLAVEHDAPVTTDEFRTLNRCLDNAIADAVTEFGRQRDNMVCAEDSQALAQRLGSLAHELRNLLNSAMLSVEAIKAGNVGISGATGGVLDRSLLGLRNIVDRSLVDVRLTVGMPAARERIDLAEFIAEVQVAGVLEAKAKGCDLAVASVEETVTVLADRQMLASAVANLLQNAFKFTRGHSQVSLRAFREKDRVLIEIEDECGGLPEGTAENLFQPFEQDGADRTGLGLGLSITRRSVEANGGTVSVRDLPGTGCVFVIDLPLHSALAGPAVAA